MDFRFWKADKFSIELYKELKEALKTKMEENK